MEQVTVRLKPGQLLKEEIEGLVRDRGIKAGVLLSIVGGLDRAVLRMAGATADSQPERTWEEPLEIVSGTGTVSSDGCHIHASVSDARGTVFGGHLRDGCRVKFTAEVVIGIFSDVNYQRRPDSATGFKELVVSKP